MSRIPIFEFDSFPSIPISSLKERRFYVTFTETRIEQAFNSRLAISRCNQWMLKLLEDNRTRKQLKIRHSSLLQYCKRTNHEKGLKLLTNHQGGDLRVESVTHNNLRFCLLKIKFKPNTWSNCTDKEYYMDIILAKLCL